MALAKYDDLNTEARRLVDAVLNSTVRHVEQVADVWMEGHEYHDLQNAIAAYYVAAVAQTAYRKQRNIINA